MGKRETVPEVIWRVVVDEPRSAAEQMACDERLAGEAVPTVRFFTWDPPALSLGWRQPAPQWLVPSRWAAASLALVERPTGGGIACHGSDLSVAVVVPRTFGLRLGTLMRAVCRSAARLCRAYGAEAEALDDAPGVHRITYCLAEASPYAVMSGGRKLAGFALRRYPQTWLIQGSLLVQPLPEALARAIPQEAVRGLEARAVSLAEAGAEAVSEAGAAERWAAHWASWWEAASVAAGPLVCDAV